MLTGIYLALIGINIGCLIAKKQPMLMLPLNYLFSCILFYGNTTNADYINYVYMYNHIGPRNSYEPVFNLLMDICQRLGMSFDLFILILWLIFGTIALYVFSRYSRNFPLFFSLYYVYQIFLDIVQIRSFCAYALFTLAVHFWLSRKKVLYLITLTLAALIHIELFFFLPLVFFNVDKSFSLRKFNISYLFRPEFWKKKISLRLVKGIAFAVFALCFVIIITGMRTSILSNVGLRLLALLGAETKVLFFKNRASYGVLLYLIIHLATLGVTYYLRSMMQKYSNSLLVSQKAKIMTAIILIQWYCVLCFPLIMINMNFYRIYRGLYLLNFAAWAMVLDSLKRNHTYYKCLILAGLVTMLYRIPLVQGTPQIPIILNNNFFFP